MTRTRREPGPDHPISVAPTPATVTARVGELDVARSDRALTLRESAYPAVQYIPFEDVNTALLQRSDTKTYCPYKGECSYYSLSTPEGILDDVVWTYETPYPAVGEIAGHVAFYPDRVTVETIDSR
jgi:uncharacterized protein (DUF427 family)